MKIATEITHTQTHKCISFATNIIVICFEKIGCNSAQIKKKEKKRRKSDVCNMHITCKCVRIVYCTHNICAAAAVVGGAVHCTHTCYLPFGNIYVHIIICMNVLAPCACVVWVRVWHACVCKSRFVLKCLQKFCHSSNVLRRESMRICIYYLSDWWSMECLLPTSI